jgi:GntR family transcriptional regulator/MocR family aminotransferase
MVSIRRAGDAEQRAHRPSQQTVFLPVEIGFEAGVMTHIRTSARAKASVPAYRDIYHRVRSEILTGRLAARARLPSSRTLASQLGVARGTVELAYQILAGEGYTLSDGARGTMVNPSLPPERKPVAFASAARKQTHHSQLRLPPKPLLFQMGLPALDAFPRKQWAQTASRVARRFDVEQFAHPHEVMGYEPLRQTIASHLRIARGIACTADQILITAGSLGALEIIAQTLLNCDDAVWVEDPGYFFARDILLKSVPRLVGVRIDEQGLDVAAGIEAAADARLAIVTPTHQFPTGVAMSMERRQALLDWADRQGSWIVEDDYDFAFHHRGTPPRSLKSLDRAGRVLYVGSFSKVLFPGLRIGYLVLPHTLTERFAQVARTAHPSPALMIQQMVEAFISEGHFARHLSRMRGIYTERRHALAAALSATLPHDLDIALTDGGMHFVANLRGEERDVDVVARLRDKGIGPTALSRCAIRQVPLNGLMIGYANIAKEAAGAAAERLRAAMR